MEFETIDDIVEMFGQQLNIGLKNHYLPKIRDFLIPYLKEEYDVSSTSKIKRVLKLEVRREDLIQSAVRYLKQESISSETEISSYTNAFNEFFKFLHNNDIENTNMLRMKMGKENKELEEEIRDACRASDKELMKRGKNPTITDRQAQIIRRYCNKICKEYIPKKNVQDMKTSEFIRFSRTIIIKLILLYGLKSQTIFSMQADMFCEETETLEIIGKKKIYILDLPNNLVRDIALLLNEQDKMGQKANGTEWNSQALLFVNSLGKKDDLDGINEILKDIQRTCEGKYNINTKITPTGLMKYAICKMMEKDITREIIKDLIGCGDDICNACVEDIKRKKTYENDYLNEKLKEIITYRNV